MAQSMPPPEWDLLLSAAQKNNADKIREMVLSGGVNPSHANGVGQSALHVAALWGNVQAVEALLDVGANPNAQNNLTRGTPLHMILPSNKCSKERKLATVLLLLHNGADKTIADNYGSLPVDLVDKTEDGRDELLKLLEPVMPDIFAAIQEQDVERLQSILSSADGDSTKDGMYRDQTPLVVAVEQLANCIEEKNYKDKSALLRIKIVKELVDAKVDPNAMGGNPEDLIDPPLVNMLACLRDLYDRYDNAKPPDQQRQEESIQDLEQAAVAMVALGAKVTNEIIGMLHNAARRNQHRFFRFLVGPFGLDVNTSNRQGMTSLHFAARSGKENMVKFLLEQDQIDVNVKDKNGLTSLKAARVNKQHEVVALLESAGAVDAE